MTNCPCPKCGAPLPVTLASLRAVLCRSCGFDGPPPPAVLERLQVAQHELARLDVCTRQFDGQARAAIRRALGARWIVIIALGLGGLPFVALGAWGISMAAKFEGPTSNLVVGLLFMFVPLIIYGSVGAFLQSRVVAARRELLAACAAVPPVHPGEAAGCAYCGAPLVSRGVDPVTRCDHCSADNVVHPTAMKEAAAKKTTDLDVLTVTLGRRAEGIVATARRVTVATVATVVGTPFLAFVVAVGFFITAARVEPHLAIASSDLQRYAWMGTDRGRCVGLVVREGDSTVTYFGDNDRLPTRSPISNATPGLPRFAARALVGKRMRTANGAVGIVRATHGAPLTNRESLVLDTGERGIVPGACAADEE